MEIHDLIIEQVKNRVDPRKNIKRFINENPLVIYRNTNDTILSIFIKHPIPLSIVNDALHNYQNYKRMLQCQANFRKYFKHRYADLYFRDIAKYIKIILSKSIVLENEIEYAIKLCIRNGNKHILRVLLSSNYWKYDNQCTTYYYKYMRTLFDKDSLSIILEYIDNDLVDTAKFSDYIKLAARYGCVDILDVLMNHIPREFHVLVLDNRKIMMIANRHNHTKFIKKLKLLNGNGIKRKYLIDINYPSNIERAIKWSNSIEFFYN